MQRAVGKIIRRISTCIVALALTANASAEDGAQGAICLGDSALSASQALSEDFGGFGMQASDTLIYNKVDSIAALPPKKMKRDWATWAPNPKRAMWLAIVLPGAGQI